MELQVGVKILIKNTKGEFLVVHRSTKKYPDAKGTWDIPGGRIKLGIPIVENLTREVKEETNLSLTSKPILIGAQDILRVTGKHIIHLTYLGITKNKKVILSKEHSKYKWLTMPQLLKLKDLDYYLLILLKNKSTKKVFSTYF